MNLLNLSRLLAAACWLWAFELPALERTNVTFQIFQFPADQIPCIDGDPQDWSIVPDRYIVGTDQLIDDSGKYPAPNPKTLDIRVRVGWVKGMNRLYFLYEAFDDYWDFSLPGLHNDTFEVVVDGDLSGGPLIERFHPAKDTLGTWSAFFDLQGVHAQNYHIFTPADGKDWCMVWGPAQWIKELPYANSACNYDFQPGQPGKLALEFWITPFDYAGAEGPRRAVETSLRENRIIGLCWAVIDYDDAASGDKNNGFWNLSRKHTMYGQASELVGFRLMPLEPRLRKTLEAKWSFQIVDRERRLVAFKDESRGEINSWKWDFGDGTTSTDQHPIHLYNAPGNYVVVLYVEGPQGKARLSKVWDVTLP
jgi:hypothetical protein